MTPSDKSIDQMDAILRRAMRAKPGAATPECADAESLAAYSDRSLAAAERERLEVHFADCMRCQLLLSDIARAEESARSAKAAGAVPWYRRWQVAIPAFAVAALVAFVAIRRPANEAQERDQLVAMAEKQAAPREDFASQVPPAVPAPAPAAPASNGIAMNEPKAATAPRAEAVAGGAISRMESAAAPAAREMTAKAAAPAAAGGAMSASGAATSNERVHAMISPPDRSVTWVVGANGMIRRISPHGTLVMQSGVSTELVAGAAPSSSVCWVVGQKGTIVRTIDGEHWQSVIAPTTDDLRAVTASSADEATITTVDGKSFATSDGGVSWHSK